MGLAQVDTCPISNAARSFYECDAKNLTLDTILSNPSHPWYDSIHLPYGQVNNILRGLGMVYNLNTPERDSIVNLYNIHCNSGIPVGCNVLNSIMLGVDTCLFWVKQFIQDSLLSSNPDFDNLVAGNGFRLIYQGSTLTNIIISNDSTYNLRPLVDQLSVIPGIIYAMIAQLPTVGGESIDDITFHSAADYDEIIFTHGWNCFEGCEHRCYWDFHVFPDCSAALVGRWGDSPPVIPGQTIISGYLTYDNSDNTPITSSMVYLVKGNDSLATMTDSQGFFHFDHVTNGNFQLNAHCVKPWGGVNSTDALKVLQHFVGHSPLSPFRQQAAAVSGNTYVNAMDALSIMKRFVGLTNSFVTGDWLLESTSITVSGQSVLNVNLKGICYGDVDGSYIPAL